jgi:hypothetical protein
LKESDMSNVKPLRLLGAATALSLSALAAFAQSTPPAPPDEKPPLAKPEAAPAPPSTQAPSAQKPQTAPKNAAAPHPLIGRSAFSSDGNKVGDVRAVKTAPDGKIAAVQLRVGGFLGFGGRTIEIPQSKFTQRGDVLQLGYTSDELSKLPEAKDAS